jgi:hypothetical protein
MSIFADDLHQSLQRAAKLTEEPSLRPRQSGRSWLVRESRPQRSCRALIACIENGGIAVGGRGDGRSVLSRRQRLRRLLLPLCLFLQPLLLRLLLLRLLLLLLLLLRLRLLLGLLLGLLLPLLPLRRRRLQDLLCLLPRCDPFVPCWRG